MTDEIVERVRRSGRYRDVDDALLVRVAREELGRASSAADAVKRVKRRLHQAIGAYRGAARRSAADAIGPGWSGEWDEATRAACVRAMQRHASTRERIGELDRFYPELWSAIGTTPASVLDLACGLNPLALPFMALPRTADYLACDSDGRVLDEVEAFLGAVGQPHRVWACDLVAGAPEARADVALLLKTVPILDRQDSTAAARVLRGLRAAHVAVSFPTRSLGGRGALVRGSRDRMGSLTSELGDRIAWVREIELRSELVLVIRLVPRG